MAILASSDSSFSSITQGALRGSKGLPWVHSRALSVEALSPNVRKFVEDNAKICQPKDIYVCDGTREENDRMIAELVEQGRLEKLTKYDNWLVKQS